MRSATASFVPGRSGRTIIYFHRSLTDFAARVEFRLPPGGDGGLVIRYPGQGDPAYSVDVRDPAPR